MVMAHHLAVDDVSWRVLVPDLHAAWPRSAGRLPALATVPTSMRTWSRALHRTAPDRVAELHCGRRAGRADPPLAPGHSIPARTPPAPRAPVTANCPPSITEPLLGSAPAAYRRESTTCC